MREECPDPTSRLNLNCRRNHDRHATEGRLCKCTYRSCFKPPPVELALRNFPIMSSWACKASARRTRVHFPFAGCLMAWTKAAHQRGCGLRVDEWKQGGCTVSDCPCISSHAWQLSITACTACTGRVYAQRIQPRFLRLPVASAAYPDFPFLRATCKHYSPGAWPRIATILCWS